MKDLITSLGILMFIGLMCVFSCIISDEIKKKKNSFKTEKNLKFDEETWIKGNWNKEL